MIADIAVATLHPRRLLEAVGRAHLAEVATRIVELVARKLDVPPGAAR